MISYIRGTLAEVLGDTVVVETGQVGINIRVPLTVTEQLPRIGEEVLIYTYLKVSEDALTLFGFLTRKRLICYPEGLRRSHFEIPEGVRVIGCEACAMTEWPCEIIVPEGVTTLEDRCFCYCTDVDICLPASVAAISPSAFYDQGLSSCSWFLPPAA